MALTGMRSRVTNCSGERPVVCLKTREKWNGLSSTRPARVSTEISSASFRHGRWRRPTSLSRQTLRRVRCVSGGLPNLRVCPVDRRSSVPALRSRLAVGSAPAALRSETPSLVDHDDGGAGCPGLFDFFSVGAVHRDARQSVRASGKSAEWTARHGG